MKAKDFKLTLATTSLVLSICGLLASPLLCPLLLAMITWESNPSASGWPVPFFLMQVVRIIGPTLGFTSVILAHIARRRLKDSARWKEMANATAGMIVG